MADFNVRSDSVNVEQIMEQIRARIREKRGVDYTEEQIRQLATVKLEKFLDPRGVRSDLLDQFRKAQPPYQPPELPNYAFEDETIFDSTRGSLRFIRRLLQPILKLFFNPNPLIRALHIQSKLNTSSAEREARREAAAQSIDSLQYEVLHNLVIEITRMGIEVQNLKMRAESLTSRLEFNERRARALESVVVYKPGDEKDSQRRDHRERDQPRDQPRERRSEPPPPPPAAAAPPPTPTASAAQPTAAPEGPGQRSRRRRRRRGRRGGGSAAAIMTGSVEPQPNSPHESGDDLEQGGDTDTQEFEGADSDAAAAEPSEAPVGSHNTPAPQGSTPAGSPEDRAGGEGAAAPAAPFDQRITRPEPIEQAFGADAHPAERTVSDPAPDPGAPAAPHGRRDDPQ
jgi:hypothetical protein